MTLRDLVATIYRFGLPGNTNTVLAAVQLGELTPIAHQPMTFTERDANLYMAKLAEDARW